MGDDKKAGSVALTAQVPNSLRVRSDGMTTVRYTGIGKKDVLLDLHPRVVPSVVGSLRAFDGTGTTINVDVHTETMSGQREHRPHGTNPMPLFDNLVGENAWVDHNGRKTEVRVVGFHQVTGNVFALVELTEKGGDGTTWARALPIEKVEFTVGKGQALAPKQQQAVLVAAATEIASLECAMPGNKWGITYSLDIKGSQVALGRRLLWANPFDHAFNGPVTFENSMSFSAQPNLNLVADAPASVEVGDEVRVAPQMEAPRAGFARRATTRGGESEEWLPAAGAAMACAAADVCELDVVGDMGAGSNGPRLTQQPIQTVSYQTTVTVGPRETVSVPAGSSETFDGKLLLMADIIVYGSQSVVTPREVVRFKTGKEPLLQGPVNICIKGEQVASAPLQFTTPESVVLLPVREAREVSVVVTQTKQPETHIVGERVVKKGTRFAAEKTYETSRTVKYAIENSGEEREVVIGHQRLRPDSKTITESPDVVQGGVEKTQHFTRFTVKAKQGVTEIRVTESWQETKTEQFGKLHSWWHGLLE